MSRTFDAIIIGAGQAGPSLAGRLTAAEMTVALVERHLVGGTCVNTGCMPTKTLVASAYGEDRGGRGTIAARAASKAFQATTSGRAGNRSRPTDTVPSMPRPEPSVAFGRRTNMPAHSLASLRTALLTTAVTMATLGLALHVAPASAQTTVAAPASVGAVPQDTAVRSFRIHVPEAALADLRRRIAMTRWPDRETVADQSQGVQLAKFQELVATWGTDYDWRKAEAKLNALPQFITTIDGVDIQFAHVRSPHPEAIPLIMTHGWPGSPLELLEVIGPLTDPTAHGGRAEDAFHLVLPTYPGYGFSGKPTDAWDPGRVARAWNVLMQRLGYERYVSQGGDWGAIISQVMAVQAPEGLLGIHTNMPGTTPPSVLRPIRNREPAPAGFSDAEKVAFAGVETFYRQGFGYAEMMNTRPQTLGYGLADSPVGVAAFLYEKIATWTDSGGDPERVLTRDEILDNITLYWLTNTGTSSSRSYWDAAQGGGGPFNAIEITEVPVAVTVFLGEIYRAPRSWGEASFKKLIYWNEVDKGGHFAAWEQPELFAEEIRAAFRPLRGAAL